jgi:hypothetical protein
MVRGPTGSCRTRPSSPCNWLYVTTDDVEGLHGQLQDRVEVVEGLHDTFYGMREFIIRDFNGFWITFGQSTSVRSTIAEVGK